ncbi:MAG: DNA-processing protein DprA [Melioribacteraceae bacterium]|nr:DNA-processing protein DprA [Melioribacteraceae bacterium]MCF8264453.1 DNA-processing protein DprA [Melioribacteraceae bacterium]MCF8414495.1 DNA-processing protein DprA [Melioribacteraceae bacterium]
MSHFGTIENIFDASKSDIKSSPSINEKLSTKLIASFKNYNRIKDHTLTQLEKLKKAGCWVITRWDENYPKYLKNIYAPPLILFGIGEYLETDNESISIVGTRIPSAYGKIQAEIFANEISSRGITVVSGMARGIDSIAQESCLQNGGRTIGIIGSGLDVIYPPENKSLFKKITKNGAVLSEFKLGTKPDAQNFPQRNRIISGISLGTLVIETKVTGGAMQTAALALDQNREVFAIPGNVNSPQSEGTNRLIQRGEAKLVSNFADILSELGERLSIDHEGKTKKIQVELNLFEEKILSALNESKLQIDRLAEITKFSSGECLVHLLNLEFSGLVKQLPGKVFIKV